MLDQIFLAIILSLIGVIYLLRTRILYLMDEATILRELSVHRSQTITTLEQTITTLKQTITTHEQKITTHEQKIKVKTERVEELAKERVVMTDSNQKLIKECDSLKKKYDDLLKRFKEVLDASIFSPEKYTIPLKTISSIHNALGEMRQFFETSRLDKIHEKERSALFDKQQEARDKLVSSFVKSA